MGDLELKRAIGERFWEMRSAKKMSQEEFGRTDRTYISKIENSNANITACKLCELCEIMGITLKEFFDSPILNKNFFEREDL